MFRSMTGGTGTIAEKQCSNPDPDLLGLMKSDPGKNVPRKGREKKGKSCFEEFVEGWSPDPDWIRINKKPGSGAGLSKA
jgi:hypothetical protein